MGTDTAGCVCHASGCGLSAGVNINHGNTASRKDDFIVNKENRKNRRLRDELGDYHVLITCLKGFPGHPEGKESACSAGDLGLISGLGKAPAEGSGNPLQYSGMENSMDRGAWWVIVHGVAESDKTE